MADHFAWKGGVLKGWVTDSAPACVRLPQRVNGSGPLLQPALRNLWSGPRHASAPPRIKLPGDQARRRRRAQLDRRSRVCKRWRQPRRRVRYPLDPSVGALGRDLPSVSPIPVYRPAHHLKLPHLQSLALANCNAKLTVHNAATHLYSLASAEYNELRQAAVEVVVEH